MANSQNGYPASADRNAIGVVPFTARGVSFPGGVKSGDVATVLRYVAEQFNDRIERLVPGWCWGHAFRSVRGATNTSNHASGTAIDCNAPNHPLGVRGTFSAAEVAEGKRILAEVDNVVRWGELYTGRVDGMHFEINANATRVAAAARKVSGQGASTPSVVQALQTAVGVASDGLWGPATDGAINLVRDATRGVFTNVVNIQRIVGVALDGIWGPLSKNALTATVRKVQAALGVGADGDWGPQTDAAWARARERYFR